MQTSMLSFMHESMLASMNARSRKASSSSRLHIWKATTVLRIMPTDGFQGSEATATAPESFVTIEYTWSHEDKPQSGLLLPALIPEPTRRPRGLIPTTPGRNG